jgi:hypothetical protein
MIDFIIGIPINGDNPNNALPETLGMNLFLLFLLL